MDWIRSASPLEQADHAKRRRDIVGELDAIMSGARSLSTAPWYPARVGDLLTVHYEGAPDMPAWYETYEVRPGAGGLELHLTDRTPGEEFADLAGFFAGPDECGGDPFTTPWMEAGPRVLTIVRDGVTVHDGPRHTSGIATGPAAVEFDGGRLVTLLGASLLDLHGGRTQLGGWVDHDTPLPFSAAVVRAQVPGRAPFSVPRATLDQFNDGSDSRDFLKIQWPTGQETPCPPA
ncbi:hypothetical protein ABZ851_37110 [Streptomyces sp. NPDC047049]|uniref:hypothetical protein n=1 Tax=Streptomyces sp. NPDC047049 TaxID=3156688 RepID=UPI003408CC56